MSVVKNIEIENQNYDIYGKNLQNVTWQEYEAIEDKNDDKAYFITDVPPSEQKKTAVKPLPTGAISTVTDAAPLPLNALKVSVEAQQDLHGYDHPWVGGAGKNKLPLVLADIKANNTKGTWNGNVYTNKGITYTFFVDNANNITGLNISGTAEANGASLELIKNASYPFNGTYIISGGDGFNPFTMVYDIKFADSSYNTLVYSSDVEKAISSNLTAFGLFIWPGITVNKTIYPMIRLATETDPTFAPYSNICPIEGWDSGEINVVGKNLIPLSVSGIKSRNTEGTWSGNTYTRNGVSFEILTNANNDVVGIKFNGTNTTETYFVFSLYRGSMSATMKRGGTYTITDANVTDNRTAQYGGTFTISNNWYLEDVEFLIPILGGQSFTDTILYPQLEVGTQATSFEPYQGTTTSQQFPQTIYDAEWDVVNGVGTDDYGFITLNGSNTENWTTDVPSSGKRRFTCDTLPSLGYTAVTRIPAISNCYENTTSSSYDTMSEVFILRYINGTNRIDIMTEVFQTVEELIAFLSQTPLQIRYKLATPTTIPLSPLSIRMLQGTNNLYADCGEVLEGEYFGNNTNQIRVNDEIIAGGNSVTFAAESKYAEHAEVADNACTFSVDENGLLTISLVSGDSNNSLSSTRSVKSTTTLPPEEEITNEKSEEEEIKDKSVEEEPSENELGITDETENEPSVEEEKDNDDGDEETPPEQNIR